LNVAEAEVERLELEFENAKKAFNSRLDFVRAQWKETKCEECGAEICYHVDWTRISKFCKKCKERHEADTSRIKADWERGLILLDNQRFVAR
jgi:hypothetical protein